MGEPCRLSEAEQQKLQQWTAAHGTPQQVALRCRIVLAAAAGESDVSIEERLSVNGNTVILWRNALATKDWMVCGTSLRAGAESRRIKSTRLPLL